MVSMEKIFWYIDVLRLHNPLASSLYLEFWLADRIAECPNSSVCIIIISLYNSKTSIFNASSPTDIDLNDLISPATYTTNGSAPSARGWKNYPANSTGYVQIEKFGGIVKQTYTVYNGEMFVRCKLTEWSSWKYITMTPVSL